MASGVATGARRIVYPTRDGKPMAETDVHRKWMQRLIHLLERWFADRPMVYVSGNLLIYYVPGDKRKHVAPDVFVVIGVRKKDRDCYLAWEEGKYPQVVIEVTSTSTREEDLKAKFVLYRDVFGVKEYFLFDPRADYLAPRLRGYRLVKGEYRPMRTVNGRLFSKQLGLHLQEDDGILLLIDPATDEPLLTADEEAEMEREARQTADAHAERERRSRAETEQIVKQQQAEIERLRRALEERRPG